MKRFWKDVTVAPADGGWQVQLDARRVKTQGGTPQVVPSEALAEMLAAEWRDQPEEVDPTRFAHRDMADYALDVVTADPADVVAKLLRYAETDTLCYRADPDEPLYQRQRALWEPLVTAAEERLRISFVRVSGVMHRPQKAATLAALQAHVERLDPFTLAALETLTTISASLITGLAALEAGADSVALYAAAHAEEDWQAELWGQDWEAQERRDRRLAAFTRAAEFAVAVRA
ncbi:ATP12 family protein [Alteraurantiacibacter buctensis]|uniref:Molecular chaperone n=1 Tax=Alteraurantiacibacter buctensis TaxID=1503981 RepID=A0A844Z037_9SPHN|nr:molecular chaperone [Alteraurantiacibacter buctensis]